MFRYDRSFANDLLVRYDAAIRSGVRSRVEQAWKRLAPDVPFDGEFSEDRVAELYGPSRRAPRSSPASPSWR